MKTDFSKWDTCCLIRELERRITPAERAKASRYYIFDLVTKHRPTSLQFSFGGDNFAYLTNHLLKWWDRPNPSYNKLTTTGLEPIRVELQRRIDDYEKEYGKLSNSD